MFVQYEYCAVPLRYPSKNSTRKKDKECFRIPFVLLDDTVRKDHCTYCVSGGSVNTIWLLAGSEKFAKDPISLQLPTMTTFDPSSADQGRIVEDNDMDAESISTQDLEQGQPKAKAEACEVKLLTHQETRQIWMWKLVAILLIGVTAALVSAGACTFLHQEEVSNYKDNVSIG